MDIQANSNLPVLVTGGTGTLGRMVVPRLRDAGRSVRVLSRHGRPSEDGVEFVMGDLETGEGVASAMEGVATVLHLAGSTGGKTDETQTRNVVEAAVGAQVSHLLYISVVGADRVPLSSGLDRAMFGYFGAKRAAEQMVEGSGVPWTTLRATQFHELMLMMARAMAKLPVVPIMSGFRFQPIDGGEVADRLVELALGEPSGLVADIGGPAVYGMDELLRGYLRAVCKRRPHLPIHLPGRAASAFREGANLARDGAVGGKSWEEFLAGELADPPEEVPSRARTGTP